MPPATCPRCRSSAPIAYRGVLAYCAACGAPRVPLVTKSTNHAGKPSIIGGALTRVLGWIVLSGGIAVGIAFLGILQALFPAGFAGWAVGGPIMVLSAIFGGLLLRGGRSLETTGVAEQRETRTSAVFSLADVRGGIVTAPDVAAALNIGIPQADDLLTDLAKSNPDHVALEVDDSGGIFYRVSSRGLSRVQSFDEKLRVASQTPPPQTQPLEDLEPQTQAPVRTRT